MLMNSDELIKAIYSPQCKHKRPLFPKLSKNYPSPPLTPFKRPPTRKNTQNNMPKQESAMSRISKSGRNKQYHDCEDIQSQVAQLMRKHNEELRQIDEREKQLQNEIRKQKQRLYEIKYGIWEAKNEIMNMNALYIEEENQYQGLCNFLEAQSQPFYEEMPQTYPFIANQDITQSAQEQAYSQSNHILPSCHNDQPSQFIDKHEQE